MTAVDSSGRSKAGVPLTSRGVHTISVLAFGMSLSLFFVISYLICIVGYFPACRSTTRRCQSFSQASSC
jgi:hypothetical protein